MLPMDLSPRGNENVDLTSDPLNRIRYALSGIGSWALSVCATNLQNVLNCVDNEPHIASYHIDFAAKLRVCTHIRVMFSLCYRDDLGI